MKFSTSKAQLSAISLVFASVNIAFAQTELKEVVVTATRFTEPASAVPHAVSVITAEEIRASGAISVNEAIIKLLGVPGRLDTSGGGNYTLDLRGFGGTADRNQVVIVDGRRIKEDDLSATNLSVVPIETVERIEVMRGAGSVQYGEGATGGVIVVTTKAGQGLDRNNSVTLGASGGSFATREAHTSAVMASGGFSVDVAAKDVKSNGHRDNFASTVNNLASTVQWSNDWLRVGALSGRQMVQSGWPGSLTAAQYESDPSQAKSTVNYGSSKSENSGVFATAVLGEWELGMDTNSRTKTVRNLSGIAYGADVAATNTNLRARHDGRFAQIQNNLVLGIDTGQWSSMSTSGVLSDSQTSAVYVTDDVTLLPSKTRFSIGGRTESLNKKRSSSTVKPDENVNAWNMGVSQGLTDFLTAYGSLGTSYRLPTADEFSFSVVGVSLQAQTSRDVELGTRWMQGAQKLEVRWYRNELNNELGYDPTANGPYGAGTGANVNLDATRRQGVELEAKREVISGLELRANVAWREAKFMAGTYAGNDIALVPRQTVALGANWRPATGHVVDMGVNWVSSQSPTFNNQCSMPSYSTVDARYGYSVGKFQLGLGVKNLSDLKYYTLAYGCTAGVTGSIYPEAGRTVTASVEMRF